MHYNMQAGTVQNPINPVHLQPGKSSRKFFKNVLDHIKILVVYYEGTVEENMRLAE
jgi:hypothetical protein